MEELLEDLSFCNLQLVDKAKYVAVNPDHPSIALLGGEEKILGELGPLLNQGDSLLVEDMTSCQNLRNLIKDTTIIVSVKIFLVFNLRSFTGFRTPSDTALEMSCLIHPVPAIHLDSSCTSARVTSSGLVHQLGFGPWSHGTCSPSQ